MNNKYNKKQNKGFTLVELLISLALLALLVGIGIPIYQNFYNKSSLNNATDSIAQNLKRVQILASASDGDSDWGFYFQTGKITIFKGSNFITRDPSYDEETTISEGITLGGLNEIVFSKFTGLPETTGSINLTNINSDSKIIIINEKGVINY